MDFPQFTRGKLAVGALALLGGCASPPRDLPPEISPAKNAQRLETRSLQDPGLRQFLSANGIAANSAALDFEALCWVGFYFNPSLDEARAQWSVARAAERSVSARPNPTLTLSPGYNSTRVPGVSPWMPGVSMDFLFPTAGKRGLQKSVAQAENEASSQAFVSAVWQLRSDLRRALIEFDTAVKRQAAAQSQLEIQRQMKALLEQRFALGSISATDVATARAALLRAEISSFDARAQIDFARAHVALALGVPLAALKQVTLPNVPVAPLMTDSDALSARAAALRNRTDLLEALAKYQSARIALQLELAKRFPDFHLGPGYQWDQGANKWTLGLSFEIPVFNHNEGPIAEARARVDQAAAHFDVAQFQAIGTIDAAVAAQRLAAEQLQRARFLAAEVGKQNRSVKQSRELGGADQLEVETSELEAEIGTSAVVDAESNLALASGQLEDALQLPFPHLAALRSSAANR